MKNALFSSRNDLVIYFKLILIFVTSLFVILFGKFHHEKIHFFNLFRIRNLFLLSVCYHFLCGCRIRVIPFRIDVRVGNYLLGNYCDYVSRVCINLCSDYFTSSYFVCEACPNFSYTTDGSAEQLTGCSGLFIVILSYINHARS